MALHLSNLRAHPRKKRKVVGRGNASGHGTTATRGQKGQRARTGGRKNLYRRGLKMFLQQLPKSRGFSSFHAKHAAVNLGDLEKKFSDGAVVNKRMMVSSGLIPDAGMLVKVLGGGTLKKKLTVYADAFSASARDAVTAAGGRAVVSQSPRTDKQKTA